MTLFRPLPVLLALAGLCAQGQALPQPFSLPNGLQGLLVENHDRPLVRIELEIPLDPAFDPFLRHGTTGFLGRLLESAGAGNTARAEFNRAAGDQGLIMAFEARREGFHWTVLADSRTQEPAMAFLANAVFRPLLDSPAMEAQRQALIKKAAATPMREGAIARFLWDIEDPTATLAPNGAGLDHLEFPEILTLSKGLLRPEHARLVLYGDLNLAQARQLALLHLGVWAPSPVPLPAQVPTAVPAGPRFAALLEGGSRAELWAGAVRKGPGRPEVEELLAILLEGISLTPYDGLDLAVSLQPAGPLLLKATGRDAAKATLISGLKVAMDLLRTKGFSQGDLDRAKLQWRARQTALPLHPAEVVSRILRSPAPVTAGAVEALAVTDVNGALAAWLAPEGLRFLLLGGDAGMLKAGEQAGLGKPTLVKP